MSTSIENLALKKDWHELSLTEQNLILAEMGMADYQLLRSTLLAINQLDAEVVPPSRLRKTLLERAEQSKGRKHEWSIPLWQAAAAVFIGIIATLAFRPTPKHNSPPTLVHVRDTVILEKIKWKERVVARPVIVYAHQDTVVEPKGVSLEDAPELLQLFTPPEGDQ